MPCNKAGLEYTEEDDVFVDSPEELIGQELHFKFKILSCRGLPSRYKVTITFLRSKNVCQCYYHISSHSEFPYIIIINLVTAILFQQLLRNKIVNFSKQDVYCSYQMYIDKEETSTKKISNKSNPDFDHVKQFNYNPVTKQVSFRLRTVSIKNIKHF